MEEKNSGKKRESRRLMCGILSFLIAAGSVTPGAEKLGFGSVTAYAEESSESTVGDSADGTESGETTTVDKTALNEAIAKANNLLEEINNDSESSLYGSVTEETKTAVDDALSAANGLGESVTQDDVNDAKTTLENANSALESAMTRSAKSAFESAAETAESAITAAEEYASDGSVASAIEAVNSAKGKTFAGDANYTAYKEAKSVLDGAVADLNTVVDNAKKAAETAAAEKAAAKKALETAIAEAETLAADEYTEDSYAKVTEAVEAANALLESNEATTDDYNNAKAAIEKAVAGLKTKEEAEAEAAKEKALQAFVSAKSAANTLLESSQNNTDVSEAWNALNTAVGTTYANISEESETPDITAATDKITELTEVLNAAIEAANFTVKVGTVTNNGLLEGTTAESTAAVNGKTITVTPAVVEGYEVVGYKFNNGDIQPEATYTVSEAESGAEVTVNVVVVYEAKTINLEFEIDPDSLVNDAQAEFYDEDDITAITEAKYGDIVKVYFNTTIKGYTCVATYDGKTISTGDEIVVNGSKVILKYTKDTYGVKISRPEIVKVDGAENYYKYNDTVSFTITVPDGYEKYTKDQITVSGVEDFALSNADGGIQTISFTMPAGGVSVSIADPVKISYEVECNVEDAVITVNGEAYSDTNKPTVGDTLAVTPASVDYKAAAVEVNGKAIEADENGTFSFTAEAGKISINVTYSFIEYDVTVDEGSSVGFTSGVTGGKATNETPVKFTVSAAEGKEIRKVLVNGTEVSAENGAYTWTVTGNVEIKVEYDLITYKLTAKSNAGVLDAGITVTDCKGGMSDNTVIHAGDTVSIKPEMVEGNSISRVSVKYGSTVIKVTSVKDDDGKETGEYTFTAPEGLNGDVEITFTVGDTQYEVSYEENTTVTFGNNPKKVTHNKQLSITVTAKDGYEITAVKYVSDNGEAAFNRNGVTDEWVLENVKISGTVVVETSAKSYTITNNAVKGDEANGWVVISGDITSATVDTTIEFTVECATGYEIDELTVSGAEYTETDGKYSFKMPAGDVSISCTFKAINYTLTQATDSENFSISAETANYGSEVTLTATDTDGYTYEWEFTDESGETVEIEVSDEGKFNMPATNLSIKRVKKAITYKVASLTADNAEVKNADGESVAEAEFTVEQPLKFTVSANDGYTIKSVTYYVGDDAENVKTVEANNGTYTINETADVSIIVTTEAVSHNITKAALYREDEFEEYVSATEGMATIEVAESAATADEVTVDVNVKDGVQIDGVKYVYGENKAEAILTDEAGKYTFVMPAYNEGNLSVNVYLGSIWKSVTLDASNVEVNGTKEKYKVGDTVEFTLSENEGYRFNKVDVTYTDADETVAVEVSDLGESKYSFVMPNADVTITVTAKEEFALTSEKVIGGEVTFKNLTKGGSEYAASIGAIEGDKIEVKVIPEAGYTLAGYTYGKYADITASAKQEDGSYVFEIKALADGTEKLLAEFETEEYNISSSGEHCTVSAPKKSSVGEYVSFTVAVDEGYEIESVSYNGNAISEANGKYRFTMPAEAVEITVVTKAIDYTVTLPENEHFTVNIAKTTYNVGDAVTLSVKPAIGYRINGISVKNGDEVVKEVEGKSITFNMPAANVVVEVEYEGRTYAIASGDIVFKNENRNYTPADDATAPSVIIPDSAKVGDTVTITVDSGDLGEDSLAGVTVSAESSGLVIEVIETENENEFLFVMPISAVKINAEFEIDVKSVNGAKTAYANAVEAAKAILNSEESKYTSEQIEALRGIVSSNTISDDELKSLSAEEINAKANAITAKIESMNEELAAAEKAAAKKALEAAIAKVPAADEYTEESYTKVTEAVKAANALLESDEATTEDYNNKKAAIEEAVEDLVTKAAAEKAEAKAALEAAIAKVPAADEYTDESYAKVTEAVKAANDVLADENATTEDYNNAKTAIEEAVDGLVKKTVVQNVKATAGDKQVTITWDAVENATQYRVQRLKDSTWSTVGFVTAASFTNTGLTNGTAYSYRVLACVDGKWSSASAVVKATPKASLIPQNVKATVGDKQVKLTWNAVEDATQYRVQRLKDSTWSTVGFVTAASFTNTGLTNGTAYSYRVLACVDGKWSSASAVVKATPKASVIPQNVKATVGNKQVKLTWNAVENATQYRVQRLKDSTWSTVGLVTAASFTNTGLTNGTAYSYRVLACVDGKWSSASAVVKATPKA